MRALRTEEAVQRRPVCLPYRAEGVSGRGPIHWRTDPCGVGPQGQRCHGWLSTVRKLAATSARAAALSSLAALAVLSGADGRQRVPCSGAHWSRAMLQTPVEAAPGGLCFAGGLCPAVFALGNAAPLRVAASFRVATEPQARTFYACNDVTGAPSPSFRVFSSSKLHAWLEPELKDNLRRVPSSAQPAPLALFECTRRNVTQPVGYPLRRLFITQQDKLPCEGLNGAAPFQSSAAVTVNFCTANSYARGDARTFNLSVGIKEAVNKLLFHTREQAPKYSASADRCSEDTVKRDAGTAVSTAIARGVFVNTKRLRGQRMRPLVAHRPGRMNGGVWPAMCAPIRRPYTHTRPHSSGSQPNSVLQGPAGCSWSPGMRRGRIHTSDAGHAGDPLWRPGPTP
ncbi:hypothetical protein MRX96_013285 [Rhipicephalus microplus]